MGWLAYGALVVSVSYILYNHPPYSWDFGPWRCSQRPPGPSLPQIGLADSAPSKTEKNSTERDSPKDDDESPQTTPRAIPTPTPPRLNIPVLNLDGPPTTTVKEPSANIAVSLSPPTLPPSSNTLNPPPPPSLAVSSPNNPASMMLPPPRPSSRAPLRPPPSAASSLRAPPTRTPPASRLTSSTLSPLTPAGKPQKSSRQVILEPGHSPLDWAVLTSDPRNNLRGKDVPPGLIRVTPSMLKVHNGRKGRDAWTSYQGKVYNITPYLPFHPGGKGELLRGAGKDSGKLFLEVHPWVNWDGMLGECMVGILVSEHEPEQQQRSGAWDEMD